MSGPSGKAIGFNPRSSGPPVIRIVLLALIIVCFLLAILPVTQWLSADRGNRTVRSIDTVALPPPEPPPPEPPPPEEEEEQEEEPELDDEPPPPSISQLEAALNPGIGDAAATAAGLGEWGVLPDALSELDVFEIADLDSRPRARKRVMPEYPIEIRERRIEGDVVAVVMIDEKGNVTVERINQSPHPDLSQSVRKALSQWRFDPPRKDGKAVKARYIQRIPFNLDG